MCYCTLYILLQGLPVVCCKLPLLMVELSIWSSCCFSIYESFAQCCLSCYFTGLSALSWRCSKIAIQVLAWMFSVFAPSVIQWFVLLLSVWNFCILGIDLWVCAVCLVWWGNSTLYTTFCSIFTMLCECNVQQHSLLGFRQLRSEVWLCGRTILLFLWSARSRHPSVRLNISLCTV